MNRYFAEQVARHPSMRGQDLIKLCYQEAFGVEHLLTDPDDARRRLREEFEEVPVSTGPLWERIGSEYCRVNLGAWKAAGKDLNELEKLFLRTAATGDGQTPEKEERFRALLGRSLEDRSVGPEMAAEVADYLKKGIRPVHHSDTYRNAERPAYRIIRRALLGETIPVRENYIWDLDGTLLDSYGMIVSSLVSAFSDHGFRANPADVLEDVKLTCVTHYIDSHIAESDGDREGLLADMRRYTEKHLDLVTLIPGAKDALERLKADGAAHFVYTHRGETAKPLLRRLGIIDLFEDVVTGESGLRPKPAPDGVLWLVHRYSLDRDHTYYVGDRTLDAECAVNAGVRSIQYLEPGTCVQETGHEDLVIRDYRDL